MEEYSDQLRLIHENRRKLIIRWRDEKGQGMRSEIIEALREHKSLPEIGAAVFVTGDPSLLSLDLRCIDLSGQNLDEVDLSKAKLQGANLARCSLKRAKLVEADLRDAFLRNTDFTEADLTGANLGGAIMENTIFYSAKVDDVYINNSTIIARTTDLPSSIRREEISPWFSNSLLNPFEGGE